MLTHEVRVAFTPKHTVSNLAISKDGSALAWSEKTGLLKLSINGSEPKKIAIEGGVKTIFFRKTNLYVGDENFGLRRYDKVLNLIWECEIPGGVSLVGKCHDFIAAVDNLGRLLIVDYDGKVINNNLQFTSIIKILPIDLGLIVVQEDGTVYCFDGNKIIWNRPPRGEVGESITAIGTNQFGQLIIGREGYALVPGDEEALEVELWDIINNKLIIRDEIKNRLIIAASGHKGTYLGFDDGSIRMLETNQKINHKLSEIIFNCKFPINTLDVTDDSIIAGSWFYLHGMTGDGSKWMVEHQGIVQFSAYCSINKAFYFAGDDQNDYTEVEPIGVIDISEELIDKDKSELTEWFESPSEVATISADDIYSDDDKFDSLLSNSKSGSELINDNYTQLMSALEEVDEPNTNPNDETLTDEHIILQDLYEEVPLSNMPIANAGEDRTYQSGLDDTSIIVLDSSNTKGDKTRIVSYSWINEEGKEVSNLPKFRAKLNKGKFRFELRILDDEGNSTSDIIHVDVI